MDDFIPSAPRHRSLRSRHALAASFLIASLHAAVGWAFVMQGRENAWRPLAPIQVSLVATRAPEPAIIRPASAAPKPIPVAKRPETVRDPAAQPASVPEPAQATPVETVAAAAPALLTEPTLAEPYVEPLYRAAYLHNDPPVYPLLARRRGVQGTVIVRAEIVEDGRCAHAVLGKTSGHPVLDQAALAAVRHWRFVPAKRGSRPVAAWVEVPIVFRLDA